MVTYLYSYFESQHLCRIMNVDYALDFVVWCSATSEHGWLISDPKSNQPREVKMAKVVISFLILTASTIITCCSVGKIPARGRCAYRIQCTNIIKPVDLDSECQGSSNYEVTIDLTIFNATESFHTDTDNNFLQTITTLKVYGNFPRTKLQFLENMFRLRNLNVVYSNVQIIEDSPLNNLFNLENIIFSHNRLKHIGDLFQFEKHPFKLHKISLSYNDIQEVPGYTFEELKSLVELDLSYNFIDNLNDKPFNNLTNLEVLRLNNNKIKYLNGAMNNLFNLKHLYLTHNLIQNIDLGSLKTINHLETFDISMNQLERLNAILFSRHWEHFNDHFVCKIILSKNLIYKIPNAMILEVSHKSLPKIRISTELDLSGNFITDIEYDAFKSIEYLTALDLSDNKLSKFYVNPDYLSGVKYLNLSGNLLITLQYHSFSLMHSLENLDLSNNILDYFPDKSLINNHELKNINVTRNDISNLHNLRITFHPSGGVLDLSNNTLSVLNIPSNEAVGLTDLILKSNNISDAYLIQLKDASNLIRLTMSYNYIFVLDKLSLQLPKTLRYLDLNFNDIQSIRPSSFLRVSHLITLKLSHNRLQSLEYGCFNGLTALVNLDLSYNQIGQLDSKLFMDLKFLSLLSLGYNDMNILIDESWIHHQHDLMIYLDGNKLSCDWLAKVLNNHNNGYSKVFPAVLQPIVGDNSIEGIPCKQEVQNIELAPTYIMDERLLKITQKILEEIQNQTAFIKKYVWRSILIDGEKRAKSSKTNEISLK